MQSIEVIFIRHSNIVLITELKDLMGLNWKSRNKKKRGFQKINFMLVESIKANTQWACFIEIGNSSLNYLNKKRMTKFLINVQSTRGIVV